VVCVYQWHASHFSVVHRLSKKKSKDKNIKEINKIFSGDYVGNYSPILTWLVAQGDFIAFSRCESFELYIK
jgi:hypothetical protein